MSFVIFCLVGHAANTVGISLTDILGGHSAIVISLVISIIFAFLISIVIAYLKEIMFQFSYDFGLVTCIKYMRLIFNMSPVCPGL